MQRNRVTVALFSPTGGTRKYCTEIAKRLDADYEILDLTRPEIREKEYHFKADDFVIFGSPVYAGRLPEIPGGIFEKVKGDQTPAAFLVSYGNREYEDALLEEKEICEANGFIGVAAGAWIAPHTFSDRIAAGRPDEKDMEKVEEFAASLKKVLEGELPAKGALPVPGNHPYRDTKSMPFHPKGNKKCIDCKKCVSVCPVAAVSLEDPKKTDTEKCIDCLACVKNCPVGSRGISGPIFKLAVSKLESKLVERRKEPEMIFVQ